MNSNTPPASPSLTVEHDLSCVRCGYNLRMLQHSGRCPECGSPVALTVELGGELAKSRPAYVRRLSRACWLIFLARALPIAGVIGELLLGAGRAISVMPLLAVLAYSLGLWLLAAREHPHLPPELRWTIRGLRLASLIFIVFLLAMLPSLLVGLSQKFNLGWTGLQRLQATVSWGSYERLLAGSAIVCFSVYVVCPIMETRLMVRLARRLADAWLGEHARIAGIGAVLSAAASALVFYWQPNIHQMIGLVAVNATIVAVLLFWLWMAVCSWTAARGFSRAAKHAEDRWRRSEAAAETLR